MLESHCEFSEHVIEPPASMLKSACAYSSCGLIRSFVVLSISAYTVHRCRTQLSIMWSWADQRPKEGKNDKVSKMQIYWALWSLLCLKLISYTCFNVNSKAAFGRWGHLRSVSRNGLIVPRHKLFSADRHAIRFAAPVRRSGILWQIICVIRLLSLTVFLPNALEMLWLCAT